MKYWIDDGTERGAFFDDKNAAELFEKTMSVQDQLRAEAKRYLDLKEWPKEEKSARRERTKAETWIHGWLNYDLRERPERYGFEFEPVSPPQPVPTIAKVVE